ncbi:MAG: type II toxin-antitoxin system HicA family toxin [Oscillospiraceae bacterium]|nr:type II toxin-antitoxin system HicA family toxin [Oscillospiraceae bacterium]
MTRFLKKNKCYFVEHGGEHDKWFSPITGKYLRIDRHQSHEIADGTLKSILKDAGLKK